MHPSSDLRVCLQNSRACVVSTLAGNLGLFMGFSVMTVIEWIEGLVFFLLAVPWLFLRSLYVFVRRSHLFASAPALVLLVHMLLSL